jgi:hypothetical protein
MSAKKTKISSALNHDGPTALAGNRLSNPIPFRTVQLPVMIFLNWIDPPVGFTMNNVDSSNPSYRVRLMNVGVQGGGTSFIVPFTETVAWNPTAPPLTRWQFQMIGVPNTSDLTTLQFYETMTVPQGPPGSQTVRSRIFLPPQATQFSGIQPVVSGSLTALAAFQVQGVVDVANNTISVAYAHVQIADNTDPTGPRDLFLQQPLS